MSSFEFYHHAVFDYLHFTLRTLFFAWFKDFCPLTFALLGETGFTECNVLAIFYVITSQSIFKDVFLIRNDDNLYEIELF